MNAVKDFVKLTKIHSEACKGTLEHRIMPAFVEKLT